MTYNLSRLDAAARSAFTVHSYDVHVDLTGAAAQNATTFTTTSRVRFDAPEATRTFLDCVGQSVERVVVNGTQIDPDFDGSRVFFTAAAGENDVTVTSTMVFSRTGEGLHRYVDPADSAVYLYTQFEPTDSRRLYANFDQPDLKAVFRLSVDAPTEWTVLSNQPVADVVPLTGAEVPAAVIPTGEEGAHAPAPATVGALAGNVRTTFHPTPRVSTYLTVLCAGPYHRVVTSRWEGNAERGEKDIDLGVYARASMAPYVDAELMETVTRQGLTLLHERFAFPYPWGKYDQIFVPEYNLGAMENPGCVTFTESFLAKTKATRNLSQQLTNVVMHEMTHMWFGDLVTPQWWDDLWLKESFADFMGSYATATATEFTDEWTSFCFGRKAWAYVQDSYPTTHPILADIPDVEAASQNFDGITYAKGASVLRQLVAYVGEEAFFAAARAFFAERAFGTATLKDFLDALSAASGRDMSTWAQAWLATSSPSALSVELESDAAGVAAFTVHQSGTDGPGGAPVLRPHRLRVEFFAVDDAALVSLYQHDAVIEAAATRFELPVGAVPRADLVLVNSGDLTYGLVHLDAEAAQVALEYVGTLADSLDRAVVWSALLASLRDALLPARDFVKAVLRHAPGEADAALLSTLLREARAAVERFVPAEQLDNARGELVRGHLDALAATVPGSDSQELVAKSLAAIHAPGENPVREEYVERLWQVARGQVEGLAASPELVWQALINLTSLGEDTAEAVKAHALVDPSGDGVTAQVEIEAARPSAAAKDAAWALATGAEASNDHVAAAVMGLVRTADKGLLAPFTARYYELLDTVWQDHSIAISRWLINGLYPRWEEYADNERATNAALAKDPAAGLRRLLIERLDEVARNERARQAAR
ncbi:aminopeptidase N [Buchananella felis]|uniref:aminopeptidase N n=1 Tax=Buchananella felis TaxID=3231492 RepID=UPI0035298EC7